MLMLCKLLIESFKKLTPTYIYNYCFFVFIIDSCIQIQIIESCSQFRVFVVVFALHVYDVGRWSLFLNSNMLLI
jgi:hypothetical protein